MSVIRSRSIDQKAFAAFRRWHKTHPCTSVFMRRTAARKLFGPHSTCTTLSINGVHVFVVGDDELPGPFLAVFKTWSDLIEAGHKGRTIRSFALAFHEMCERVYGNEDR